MRNWSIWQLLKTISVEPVIFCNALAITFHNVVYRFGIYRVICQKLYGDDEGVDCADLSNSTYGNVPELAVQRAATDWSTQSAMSYLIPATIADIMLGAVGDRYGRKLNVLMGIFGMMLAVFPVAIIFSFPKTMPMYVLLIANALAGLTGFVSIVVISAFAYLADTVVDQDLLTVRMTLMQVCINVGSIFGPLLASATSRVLRNSIQEVITLSILAVSFTVGLVVLKQVPPTKMRRMMMEKQAAKKKQAVDEIPELAGQQRMKDETKPNVQEAPTAEIAVKSEEAPQDGSPQTPDSKPACGGSRLARCWTPFVQVLKTCWTLLKEIWVTYTKPREGHIRAYILTASAVVFVSMAAELGLRYTIFSLYVQKAPLSWNQDMIGYYDSANGAVTTAGTITGIFVFKKLLGFADTTVVLIALASGIAESLMIAFGTRTWMLFLSAVIGCLSSLVKPCVKSFVAKLVAPDEVGKAFTIFGISQNIAYLLSALIYNNIYKATLETFPGFVYVLAAFILFLIFLQVFWVHIDQKKAAGEKWHGVESLKTWITERSSKGKFSEPVQADVEATVISPA